MIKERLTFYDFLMIYQLSSKTLSTSLLLEGSQVELFSLSSNGDMILRNALESGLFSNPSSVTYQLTSKLGQWVTWPWDKFGYCWLSKPSDTLPWAWRSHSQTAYEFVYLPRTLLWTAEMQVKAFAGKVHPFICAWLCSSCNPDSIHTEGRKE